jgi:hypothetical protein
MLSDGILYHDGVSATELIQNVYRHRRRVQCPTLAEVKRWEASESLNSRRLSSTRNSLASRGLIAP